MKLNRDQIIKALECCINDECDKCGVPFGNCQANLMQDALALIKELTEENDYWKQQAFKGCMDKGQMDDEIRRLTEENERLRKDNERYAELEQGWIVTGVKKVRADTVREMQGLIFDCLDISVEGYSSEEIKSDVRDMVYQIAKEMVGGDK